MEIVELFAEMEPWIAAGLQDGSLTRWGSGIRVSKGHPGGGQFVRHLREVYPADFVSKNTHLVRYPPTLDSSISQLLQLNQVSAAASVLNLGVSAVGFAVMNYKLNRLQSSVNALADDLRGTRAVLEHGLERIDEQLVEVRYLQTVGLHLLTDVRDAVEMIRKDLLAQKAAVVASWLRSFARLGTRVDLLTASRELDQVRLSLEQTVDAPAVDSPRWADVIMRYRIWCMAVVAQVAACRMAGDDIEAADLSRDAANRSQEWVGRWAAVLLPPSEFDGIFRLGAEPFRQLVQRETILRLAPLQVADSLTDFDISQRVDQAALHVAGRRSGLDSNWTERSLQAARLLDLGAETQARLTSLAAEMHDCRERRLGYDEWEGRKLVATKPELRFLEMPK